MYLDKYPANWKTEIRPRILKRDKNKCQHCGKKAGSLVKTSEGKEYVVKLAIAHLDRDAENHAVSDDRLLSLCRACHFKYDKQDNLKRRADTKNSVKVFPGLKAEEYITKGKCFTLAQIRYLLDVCETGHFTKSSERMHITQPTLSIQLKKLEKITGLKLLKRKKRPITPTGAGSNFIMGAKVVIGELNKLEVRTCHVFGLQHKANGRFFGMTIRQISYLVSVYVNRSYTVTARLCDVEQSTVSMQIKKLQRGVGITFFKPAFGSKKVEMYSHEASWFISSLLPIIKMIVRLNKNLNLNEIARYEDSTRVCPQEPNRPARSDTQLRIQHR